MATYVLIHGGWHGGWCWSNVAADLRSRGHRVLTPTLAGLGEYAHSFSADIVLSTHIMDVVSLLRLENLSEVVLCGHSYGGFVISGVIERESDRIASVVYLDAFVPNDGECLFDIVPEAVRARHLAAAGANGGVAVPPISARHFNTLEANCALVDALCVPQPIGTFIEKIKLSGARDRIARKSYVRASGYPSVPYDHFRDQLSGQAGWTVYDIPATGHDVMLDAPAAVVEVLLQETVT